MLKYNFFNKNLNIILLSFLFISIIASKYNTVFDFGYSLRFHDLIFLFLLIKFFFEIKPSKLIIPQNNFTLIVLLFLTYFFIRFIIDNNFTNLRYLLTFAVFFLFNSKLTTKYNLFKSEIFTYLILILNSYILLSFFYSCYEFNLFHFVDSKQTNYLYYFFLRYFDGVSTINQMSLFSCFSLILLFHNKKIKLRLAWYLILFFNILIFRSYVVIVFTLLIIGLYAFKKIKINFLNLSIIILIATSVLNIRLYNFDKNNFLDLNNASSLIVRNDINQRDYEIFKNKFEKDSAINIVFGKGVGYIYKLTSEYNPLISEKINEKYQEKMPWYENVIKNDTTHNIIFQLYFEHGLVGISLYFYLLFLFIKIFFYFKKYQQESSLIYMLTFTHLHFHMFNPGEIEIFLILFSIMFHNLRSENNMDNPSFPSNKN